MEARPKDTKPRDCYPNIPVRDKVRRIQANEASYLKDKTSKAGRKDNKTQETEFKRPAGKKKVNLL